MKLSTLVSRLVEASDNKGESKKLLASNRNLAGIRLARALKDECYRVWTTEPTRARRIAAALKTLAEVSPSTETSAIYLWVEGIADITRGKLESAARNLDRASTLLARAGRKHESAQPQVAKLMALAMLGRYEEAQAAGRKARKIFEQFDDQLAAGKIEMNLSNVVSRRDQYRLAEQYCLSAYKRFEDLGETAWQTMAENGLANTYAELNDFERAEEYYGRALARARRARMNLTVAEIEASVGNLALFRGRYADALRSLERSRQMYERLGMPHQTAIAELEIADGYAEINLTAEATEIYRRLIPTLHRLKLRAEEARARANFGGVLFSTGDLRQARNELKRAASLYTAEKNRVAAAAVNVRRASVDAGDGRFAAALELIESVMPTIDDSENVRLKLSAMWLRGDVLRKLGDLASAEPILTRTLNEAVRSDQPTIAQSAMNSLGLLSEKHERRDRAERFFKSAIETIEIARAPLPGEEFRMAFLAGTLEPYRNLTRLYLDGGEIEKAFLCVERSRSRALLESVSGSISSASGSTTKLREELNRYYLQLDRADDTQRSKIENEIRKRERKLATGALRAQSTAKHKRVARSQAAIDLDLLRRRLGTDRALVEFVADGELFSAFIVTNGGVEYASDLVSRDEILSLLEGLHFQFGALRFRSLDMASFAEQLKFRANAYLEKLHAKLIGPLRRRLGDRDLIIVPAGELNYVPFQALFDGDRYLIESHDISYSPSASVWLQLNSRKRGAIGNALLFGFADGQIPLVNEEVKALARSIPNSVVLTGRRATFEAFRSNTAEYDLIHLACHGQFRPDNPMFSSLHLADGWVTVRDVCSSRLNASLVTLSACETGLNKIHAGEEILGLARGFLSAGAGSLVLSLWTVNDEATARLMGDFYANLQRGLTVSASLKIAQKKFIDRGEHPYFWSPFFAIG